MAFDVAKYARDFFKLPRPPLQKRWVGEYEGVTTHTQGRVAKRLIKERRPYEDADIRKYREKNYEPVTQGPFSRFKTNLQRVYSASQVTIEVAVEKVQQFIAGPNFNGMDLRSYWSRHLTGRMIDDPNGVLVRWVKKVPDTPNEEVTPELHLVLCKNIRHFTDEVFTWLSNEKSMVMAPDPAGGGQDIAQPQGEVYYVVTKTEYWRFVQVGKRSDKVFRMEPHYSHQFGYLPLDVLGGDEMSEVEEKTNEDVYWLRSFIASAIPYANECARQFSDHQGVLVTSAFPLREMTPVKCVHPGCVEGFIKVTGPNDAVSREECPTCHGKGKVAPFSPYGTLLREEQSVLSGDKTQSDVPMVRFLNPDTDILEFGGKTWRDYLKDVERELNLLFVDEAQSGVAKEIDREDKVAKLDQIGHHLFLVLMKRTIIDIGKLMFAEVKEEDLNITLPPTFVPRTEQDLVDEMKAMNEGEVPTMTRSKVVKEYNVKRFPGDKVFSKITEVLLDYDPLFGQTEEQVTTGLMGGIVDTTLVRRHELCFTACRRLVREKGEKVLDAEDIFAQIDAKVEELMPAARVQEEAKATAELNNPTPPEEKEEGTEEVPPVSE